jgi:hypothetical protein
MHACMHVICSRKGLFTAHRLCHVCANYLTFFAWVLHLDFQKRVQGMVPPFRTTCQGTNQKGL